MSGEYIGRCDMCGKNLYRTDDTVTVITGFVAMTVCRDCCMVRRGEKNYYITDLLDKMEESNDQFSE